MTTPLSGAEPGLLICLMQTRYANSNGLMDKLTIEWELRGKLMIRGIGRAFQ